MYIKPRFDMINTHVLDQNLKELVQFMHTVSRNPLVTLTWFQKLSPLLKLFWTQSEEIIRWFWPLHHEFDLKSCYKCLLTPRKVTLHIGNHKNQKNHPPTFSRIFWNSELSTLHARAFIALCGTFARRYHNSVVCTIAIK